MESTLIVLGDRPSFPCRLRGLFAARACPTFDLDSATSVDSVRRAAGGEECAGVCANKARSQFKDLLPMPSLAAGGAQPINDSD